MRIPLKLCNSLLCLSVDIPLALLWNSQGILQAPTHLWGKSPFKNSSMSSKKLLHLSALQKAINFVIVAPHIPRRVEKYGHKNFLHCSQCVTNFHYGFRAININKRKRERKWRKKSNFPQRFLPPREGKVTSKTSTGRSPCRHHYNRELMWLLWLDFFNTFTAWGKQNIF